MIDLREMNEVDPVCPHCNEAQHEIWFKEMKSTFGRRYIYFCSSCKKVLGISHRKGFL